MKNKFDMTREGFILAKAYLIKVGKYEEFMSNMQSTDGFSLVGYANTLYRKNEKQGE